MKGRAERVIAAKSTLVGQFGAIPPCRPGAAACCPCIRNRVDEVKDMVLLSATWPCHRSNNAVEPQGYPGTASQTTREVKGILLPAPPTLHHLRDVGTDTRPTR